MQQVTFEFSLSENQRSRPRVILTSSPFLAMLDNLAVFKDAWKLNRQYSEAGFAHDNKNEIRIKRSKKNNINYMR
jgi:hypothetical protein